MKGGYNMTREELKFKKETNTIIMNDVIKEARKLANEFEKLVSELRTVETEEDANLWDKKLDSLIDTLTFIELR